MQMLRAKLKRHSLILVLDGRVENPEFSVSSREEFDERLAKWKRSLLPTLKRSNVEFWELHRGEFTRVNYLSR